MDEVKNELKYKGTNRHVLTPEDAKKGGKAKSIRKTLANKLIGLKKAKHLTDEQRIFIALLEDKKLGELMLQLVKSQLGENKLNFGRKSVIIQHLLKLYEIASTNQIKREFLAVKILKEIRDGRVRTEEISDEVQ